MVHQPGLNPDSERYADGFRYLFAGSDHQRSDDRGHVYALVALGFVLIFKASGIFNFAQGVMALFAALALYDFLAEDGWFLRFLASRYPYGWPFPQRGSSWWCWHG